MVNNTTSLVGLMFWAIMSLPEGTIAKWACDPTAAGLAGPNAPVCWSRSNTRIAWPGPNTGNSFVVHPRYNVQQLTSGMHGQSTRAIRNREWRTRNFREGTVLFNRERLNFPAVLPPRRVCGLLAHI